MGNQVSHPKLTFLSRLSALHPSMFSLHATAHHGVPSNARALAFCDLLGILPWALHLALSNYTAPRG
uniref:Uncharacterized protein n=1 Tax=Hyaloperonospora arabidopsidis (strain Emoy2) TaxID=559515 RepID=M4BYN0_HYAAE